MDLLQHLLLLTAAQLPLPFCRRCSRDRRLLLISACTSLPGVKKLTASRDNRALVQVAGATRIMEMRQSRSGSHLLLSCQDRSIKLLELTPAVQLLQQPSFTLAQAQQKLAAAKVGAR